jgi:histidyl-tRNA synthetase
MPKTKKPVEKKPAKPEAAPAPEAIKPKKTQPTPQLLRGMKDILPSEQKFWAFARNKAEELATAYGFERLDTPILEETALFIRGVGKQTDIVEKEMYSFQDQGGENMTLRPEATAAVMRAYINHGMWNLPQPIRLFHYGPMFRHERPQAGRYRQLTQGGCDIIGDKHSIIDAQLMRVGYLFFKELGLDVVVHVNSIGDVASRETYKTALVEYYRSKRSSICENCKKRLVKNPMRLLDCKEEGCIAVRAEAPQIVDFLTEEPKNHFVRVLEYLDEMEVPYQLNPHLVRGLDYYSFTVFEFVGAGDEEKHGQTSLGAGGRYDGLAEVLGGNPTPACGFSWGIERTILKLKEKNIDVPDLITPDVYLAQLGEPARRKMLSLYDTLRKEGIRASENFSRDSLKSQLEAANRYGVRYTLILGQKEVLDGTVLIRDMDSGIQEIVDSKKVVAELKKKLALPAPPKVKPVPPPEPAAEETLPPEATKE